MRQTFDYAYYCRESKVSKKSGKAPIELSISINGVRKYVTLPLKYSPSLFNKAKKPKDVSDYLKSIDRDIHRYIIDIAASGIKLSTDVFVDVFKNGGVINKEYKVSNLVDEYINIISSKNITEGQKGKYRKTGDLMIKIWEDKTVSEITNADCLLFQNNIYSLYHANTAAGIVVRMKAMIKFAHDNNKIASNPSVNIKVKRVKNKIEYLEESELKLIMEKEFGVERLNRVRDLFLFMAGTGLAYTDLAHLEPSDVVIDEGTYYIKKARQKTDNEFTAVLLPWAINIWEKYKGDLPKMTNQRLNGYLKEIGDICGIQTELHCHLARKTYSTYLLNSGVRLDVVAKAIGDTDIRVVRETYAFMKNNTVINEISEIVGKSM